MEREQKTSLGGQAGKSASNKASGNADGDRPQKRGRLAQDENADQRREDITVKAEETKAEDSGLKMGSVSPEKQNSNAEEICDNYETGTKSVSMRIAEWYVNQGYTPQNEKETKDQILADQNLRSRDTSGKRGNPPQLEALSQRETINIDNKRQPNEREGAGKDPIRHTG